jgi:hypothetical protein
MNDVRVLEVLHNASSLELFRLNTLIERLLADPQRVIAIRKGLRLGQKIRFYDPLQGALTEGRITAMADRHASIEQARPRRLWKLPYAAIEPPDQSELASDPTPAPPATIPRREDFRRGDRVSFEDRYLKTHLGVIVRINPRTATVTAEGVEWRVSFALLRPVLDIEAQSASAQDSPDESRIGRPSP